jgi:hypothetical protein
MAERIPAPEEALHALAEQLESEQSVISPHVRSPGDAEPALGMLAAVGPRGATAPGQYSLLIEAIREGYLLHYAEPRVVVGADADLALLAGDYLYALGLERLAALGDVEAVRELADLISLAAQLHDVDDGRVRVEANALWLASAIAVGVGPAPGHEQAKAALRGGQPNGGAALWSAASKAAASEGLSDALDQAAEAIGFESQ